MSTLSSTWHTLAPSLFVLCCSEREAFYWLYPVPHAILAITEIDIQCAMRTLGDPNEHEAAAVDARQEIDLKARSAPTC